MAENTFKKVGSSGQRMYGSPGMLACGYAPEEQDSLLKFLEDQGFAGIPVVFVPGAEEDMTLEALLNRPHLSGFQMNPGEVKALILSGITEGELQRLLSAFRGGVFPRPLLAALTPTSQAWTVQALLKELIQESEAMRRLQRKRVTKNSTGPGKDN